MKHERQPVPVPVVVDHYVNIYKPQEDVYTLPTRQVRGRGQCTFTYEQGRSYPDWRTNDHTFIKDHNNRWHCFGITKPWMSGDNSHAGEGLCFHAVAPETENGTFAGAVKIHSWQERPKIAEGGVGWAPGSIQIGAQYNLIGSQLDRMVSDDLENWTYAGKLGVPIDGVGGEVRDPQISVIDGVYHMVICCCDKVGLSTSEDFVTWTDMRVLRVPSSPRQRQGLLAASLARICDAARASSTQRSMSFLNRLKLAVSLRSAARFSGLTYSERLCMRCV